MVIQVKASKVLLMSLFRIDKILPDRYKIRRVPFNSYYTLARAGKILSLSPSALLNRLAVSRQNHGLLLNTEGFIHPDSLKNILKGRCKRTIRAAIKEGEKQLERLTSGETL